MKNLSSSEEGLLKRFFINMTIGTALNTFDFVSIIALPDESLAPTGRPVLSAK